MIVSEWIKRPPARRCDYRTSAVPWCRGTCTFWLRQQCRVWPSHRSWNRPFL